MLTFLFSGDLPIRSEDVQVFIQPQNVPMETWKAVLTTLPEYDC